MRCCRDIASHARLLLLPPVPGYRRFSFRVKVSFDRCQMTVHRARDMGYRKDKAAIGDGALPIKASEVVADFYATEPHQLVQHRTTVKIARHGLRQPFE